MILTIKNVIETYRKQQGVSVDELCACIGLSRNALYVRYRNPEQWRLGELANAYTFLGVEQEDKRFE
ncbi:MAG: hypothetical protein KBT03_04540 [Bacteroidales bacterium]|nr:hypothetical protein [Candidatus Scybalousia scybalohippi]